jgi:hypothetical protein
MIDSAEQKDECILGVSMKLELLGAVECNNAGQLSIRRRNETWQSHVVIARKAVAAMGIGEEMAWKKQSQIYVH